MLVQGFYLRVQLPGSVWVKHEKLVRTCSVNRNEQLERLEYRYSLEDTQPYLPLIALGD